MGLQVRVVLIITLAPGWSNEQSSWVELPSRSPAGPSLMFTTPRVSLGMQIVAGLEAVDLRIAPQKNGAHMNKPVLMISETL